MSIRTLFTACVATMLWAACDNNSLTEQAAPCEDVHIRVAAPTRAAHNLHIVYKIRFSHITSGSKTRKSHAGKQN